MSEHESRRDAADEGEERDVKSAAPSDESKVVGERAEVPAGEGEEADEGGEGSSETSGDTKASGDERQDGHRETDDRAEDREQGGDDRDELAREIESDPSSNPEDPMLKDIKGG